MSHKLRALFEAFREVFFCHFFQLPSIGWMNSIPEFWFSIMMEIYARKIEILTVPSKSSSPSPEVEIWGVDS